VSNKTVPLEEVITEHLDEVSYLINSDDQASTYEDYESFQFLIIRRMTLHGNSLKFKSEVYIFKDHSVYSYNREHKHLELLKKGTEELHERLFALYQKNGRIITGYFEEIESLETKLFNREMPPYFMDLWFSVKKDLAKVENFYFRNAIVYKEFLGRMGDRLSKFKDEFKDIEETIQFQNSSIQTFKGRLDSLHNYHDSVKADKLNNTLLLLTIISGVFLPLNLIVGFFGMNTDGLPMAGNPHGTQNVIYLLGGVVIFCLVGMRLLKAVDRLIFRTIFGRYDFYKKLFSRIDDIDSKLRGN